MNKKSLRRRFRKIPGTAVSILLVLSMLLSVLFQKWHASAEDDVLYLEDVKISVAGSAKSAKSYFEEIGYDYLDADLNPSTGTDKWVYLGYKTTRDRTKAITSIRMMPMQGGYQLYNYDDIITYMSSQSSATAALLLKAAEGFAENFRAGSPRAKDAHAGLNMFYISEKSNYLLGDYIVNGNADLQFFTDLVVKSSSGTVNAVASLLNTGLTPYENDYDEESDMVTTVPWASMIRKSAIWEKLEEGMSKDEADELARKYDDEARNLFYGIQYFTSCFINARARYEMYGYQPDSENPDEVTQEDGDVMYLGAYELLQQFYIDENTKLGDWFLSIGCSTLATVDLKMLYPVLDAMGEGLAAITGVTGFLNAVLDLQDNVQSEEFRQELSKLPGTSGKNGEAVMDVFTALEEDFNEKTFAFTSEAIRKHGAENAPLTILERLGKAKEEANQLLQNISLVVGVASVGVAFVALVAKIGIAVTLSAAGAAAVTSSAMGFFSSMAVFASGAGMLLGHISIAILVITIGVIIACMIYEAMAEENKAKYQSAKFDYIFDSVTYEGLDTNILYKSALGNNDQVGDINAAKQWKWVALCYSTDTAAGSPIIADENGEFFKAVKNDPTGMDGYDSIKHFGERDPADFNAYCSKGTPVYVHYGTEESLAKKTPVIINEPDESEPAEPSSEEAPTEEPTPEVSSETDVTDPSESAETASSESDETASSETNETDPSETESSESDETESSGSSETESSGSDETDPSESGGSETADSTEVSETEPSTKESTPEASAETDETDPGKSSETASSETDETKSSDSSETASSETDETKSSESSEAASSGESETEPSTEPPEPEQKLYIYDVIIGIGKDAAEAKNSIINHKRKYYVFDYDLSPTPDFCTYIGYSLTENPDDAITDLRVAPYSGGGDKAPVMYGDVQYTQIDILGYYIGKGSKQGIPATDALYYTKDKRAGSAILADGFHVVRKLGQLRNEGWEPVSFFGCDIPYNFNTKFEGFESVWDGPYFNEDSSTVDIVYYCSTGDHNLNNKLSIYLFYEPSEKYTSGVKYLSGMLFVGGYDTINNEYLSGEIEHDVTEYAEKIRSYPRAEQCSVGNLATTISDRSYNSLVRRTQQYIFYTWSYNPKRAVSDLAVYQGDSFTVTLPYTMSKPTDGINRNYVGAISLQQQYTSNLDRVARYVSPYNCYMTFDSMIIASGNYRDHISDSYTKTLPEGIDFGYSKLRFLPTELYVSGPAEGLAPLTLSDVVLVTGDTDITYTVDGTKVNYSFSHVSGDYLTLDGKTPDAGKSFRPIVEMKDPNSTTPFNLAYPESWDEDDKHRKDTFPVYMFIRGQLETPKKYISALSIGAFSREQYKDSVPDASKDVLDAVDMMVNNQAMVSAVMGCTDELKVKNLSAQNQNNTWYNLQKNGKSSKDWPENQPAAYIGVTRTDSPAQAIRGVILYKTKSKTAPQTIEIDKVQYICAGVSAPVIMFNERYYLYYTYNSGASPGVPIEDIVLDQTPIIDGAATNLCFNEGSSSLYGYKDQYMYIHLVYDQGRKDFYNKLYIGRGSNERRAMIDLLSQGCVEYVKIDLNKGVRGDTVLLGYRTGSYNWEEIGRQDSEAGKKAVMARQERDAIYDIIVTTNEPYHAGGIISKGIYYTPVSETSLNSGCSYGADLYVYYATPYYSQAYNKRTNQSTASPETVFTGFITRLAFAEKERVPYTVLLEEDKTYQRARAAAMAELNNYSEYLPWEYVMEKDDLAPVDVNYGASACNGDYCEDSRIHMFAQRSDGSVKPAGQITGGFLESSYEVGDVYIKK